MPLVLGLKVALAAATAIGAGLAIAHHWDELKTLVENFDEIKEEVMDSIKRKQRRKVPVSDGSFADDYDVDTFAEPDSVVNSAIDSDTDSGLQRRNVHAFTMPTLDSSGTLSECGTLTEDGEFSEYSLVPSDEEFSE